MFTIYEIQNTVTGFRYIGCSKQVEKRWKEHRRELNYNKHCNSHLQNAWNKYGESTFSFKVIAEYSSESAMFLEERKLIQKSTNLYNLAEGGLGGDPSKGMTEDAIESYRKIQSKAQLRRFENLEERAKANPFANLSEEEYSSRIQVWSAAKKGSKNNRYKHNNPVLQVDLKTKETIKIWADACEAAEAGYNRKYIVYCCQNKKGYKSHGGFSWQWQVVDS